ncbi:MAG: helix-hairpin-helix domain-containing protein [Cocleimonas sp.]|nr:helix-hairpin-helix domain-containing protein [Cocleimonas sp.]
MSFKSLILVVTLSLLSLSSFADVVNLNKANAATLQYHLKGIGVKKAGRIVSYRVMHQGFKHLDEVMEIRGIGKKTFQTIKSNLSLTEGIISLSDSENKVEKTASKPDVVEEKLEGIDRHTVKNTEI